MKNWSGFVKKRFPNDPGWQCLFGETGEAHFWSEAPDWNSFLERARLQAKKLEAYQASGQPLPVAEWLRSHASETTCIWSLEPELSYTTGHYPSGEDQPFRRVMIYHLKRDKVEAAENALKTFAEIDRKLGSPMPRAVFRLRVGADGPALAMIMPAKDVFDYYARLSKRKEARRADPRWKEVMDALDACSRSKEDHQLTIQPELSKLP